MQIYMRSRAVPISEWSTIALVGNYPEEIGDDLYRCGVNLSRNYDNLIFQYYISKYNL